MPTTHKLGPFIFLKAAITWLLKIPNPTGQRTRVRAMHLKNPSTRQKGDRAQEYLISSGYTMLETNWMCLSLCLERGVGTQYQELIDPNWAIRFDIITINFYSPQNFNLEHFKDAFFPGL